MPDEDVPEEGFEDDVEPDPDVAAELEHKRKRLTRTLEESNPEERLKLQLDLADVYLEQAMQHEMSRLDALSQRVDATTKADEDHLMRVAEHFANERLTALERAADIYLELLSSTRPAARSLRGKARYNLAEVRVQQDRGDEAAEHWKTLIRDDPDHALVIDALVRLGDHAFAETDMDEAKRFYLHVADQGASSMQAYALYKLGWIAYNQSEGERALQRWVQVIQLSSGPEQRPFRSQVMRDCAMVYVLVGRPERAAAFFKRLDAEAAPRALKRLADLYRAEGNLEAAEKVEHALGTMAPHLL